MSGTNQSGYTINLPPPAERWITETGIPTPHFYEIIRGLVSRTGGTTTIIQQGAVGLSAFNAIIASAQNTANLAVEDALLALMIGLSEDTSSVTNSITSASTSGVSSDSLISALMITDGGGVVSITAGAGLSGGVIINSGTVSLAAVGPNQVLANIGTGSAVPVGTSASGVIDTIGTAQGDLLYRDASSWTALAHGTSGQVLKTQGAAANPTWGNELWNAGSVTTLGSGLALNSGTLALVEPYIVSGFVPTALTASQTLIAHQFAKAVVFPSNFGTTVAGAVSKGGSLINATAATTLTVNKCLAASDPTVIGNWSSVGVGVFGAGGHAATFTTSGTVAFAQGDFIDIVGPVSPDATLSNVFFSLAGDR